MLHGCTAVREGEKFHTVVTATRKSVTESHGLSSDLRRGALASTLLPTHLSLPSRTFL